MRRCLDAAASGHSEALAALPTALRARGYHPHVSAPVTTNQDDRPPSSPLHSALARVGDRWSLLLVEALLDGERRFGELAERVPGIAPNILTDRLRRLEHAGVIVAAPYSHKPLRVRYRLTVDGHELAGVLRLLAAWGSAHVSATDDAAAGPGGQPARHEACGTPVDARWYCPTCARVTADDEVSELRYL
jgi:DNA-binding HxlR family transcriptional regulator